MPTLGVQEQEYELLVRTNEMTIRKLCFKESGGDPVLCAELVQDVFYDLWKSMPLFDPPIVRSSNAAGYGTLPRGLLPSSSAQQEHQEDPCTAPRRPPYRQR